MKFLSIAIIICSLAAAGVAVEHNQPITQHDPAIEVPRTLPTRRIVREDEIIRKMDVLQKDLSYLKGKTERR